MFLAKAGGQDVQTPTPITREEMFLQKIIDNGGTGGGSGGGSDTPSGNFKKKFISLARAKRAGSYKYDFVTTLGSTMLGDGEGVAYDEEILPTKTLDGIKVTTESEVHIYFIEDENDLFIYADFYGTGTNEWVSISDGNGVQFGGVLTDTDRNQMIPGVPYVLFYYVEAE
jgi:hypothetical protein